MKKYRTVWISDTHLGTRGTKSHFLLNFLENTRSDYLYIVGDFIDGWQLKKSWNWISEHNEVIQTILRKAQSGTRVTYIPGNHDEFARKFVNLKFGNISLRYETSHITADGRNILVLHGDEYDVATKYARWIEVLGSAAYNILVTLNRILNDIRRIFGYPYWSLSTYLKHKTKKAQKYFDDFRQAAIEDAKNRGFDGVICGHVHYSSLSEIDGITYANTGDWVDNCTALVEEHNGELKLISWTQITEPVVERYNVYNDIPMLIQQN